MSAISPLVNLREAAREWIAETIAKHLHPHLACAGRVRNVAAAIEEEAHATNMPIETALERAVKWCDEQNNEAGLAL